MCWEAQRAQSARPESSLHPMQQHVPHAPRADSRVALVMWHACRAPRYVACAVSRILAGRSRSHRGAWALVQGSFGNASGQATCTPCPAGRRAGALNSTNCSLCESGRYADAEGSANCIACPPVSSACVRVRARGAACGVRRAACGVRRVSRRVHAHVQGSIAPGVGATGCSTCTAGFFSPNSSGIACSACAAGTYAGSTGSSTCIACAAVRRAHTRHRRDTRQR